MNPRFTMLFIVAVLIALLPQVALAQDDGTQGLLIRIDGPVSVEADQNVGHVFVIDGDVTVDGTVDGTLIVIDGRTVINGTVTGDIVAITGRLELGPNAVVTGDIAYNDTDFIRDPDATVQGSVRDDLGSSLDRELTRVIAWISLFSWFGMTILMLLAGLVFAGVGGHQLGSSARLITSSPLQSLLAAFLLWVVLMAISGGLLLTVFGIPIGIVTLLILAAIWALGYLVAGTRIGAALVRRSEAGAAVGRPYLQTVVGVIVIQLVALLPVLVTLVFAYAGDRDVDGWSVLNAILFFLYWVCGVAIWLLGVLGAGALTYYAWRGWRGEEPETRPT